jgi:hypothetical protein
MPTYVNDLRLKEIGTGESSGSWGTETNTNLELIGEAMGHGTEAVANSSTDTITMADGSTDGFRCNFLRLTGGGQACTVTFAPNTLSHTWIVRNETAATLTISQGSGANVAISAGQTKILATDGGGSGAIVYEMDDLELAGNLKVDGDIDLDGNMDVNGTLETDALTIGGTSISSVISGTTVTNATNSAHVLVTDNESTNENNLVTFVEGATSSTGNVGLEMDGNFTYNPSTGTVSATAFSGALTGNVTGNVSGTAATVTTAAQSNITSLGTLTGLTVSGTTDLAGGNTNGIRITQGAIAIKNGGTQSYIDFYCESSNAHYARLQAPAHSAFSGNITLTLPASTGTIATTSDIAGTTVTNATNAAHVQVTDNESANESNLVTFVENAQSSSGNHGLEMDGNFTYNPSNGTVTATNFSGNLTGTLQTAAQTNITSIGTLSTLTVDDITINGSTISDSGNFDIDCGGDITFDADGGNLYIKDGGTTRVTFNLDVTPDLVLTSSNQCNISSSGGGKLAITSSTNTVSISGVDISGDTIANSSGNFNFDFAGDLNIDADGGDISFFDGGTRYFQFNLDTAASIATHQGNFVLDSAGTLDLDASSNVRILTSGSVKYTLPNADGTSGQVLTTDGSGTISFSTPASGGVANDASQSTSLAMGTTSRTYGGTGAAIFGIDAAQTATSGNENTIIGAEAWHGGNRQSHQTFIGYRSAYSASNEASGPYDRYNTAVGSQTMYNYAAGDKNCAFGADALYNLTGGYSNIAIGYQAAYTRTTGGGQIAIGYQAAYSDAETGNYTTIGGVYIGYQVAYSTTYDGDNIVIGQKTAKDSTNLGERNVIIGNNAANSMNNGDYNIILGHDAAKTMGQASYSVILGNEAAEDVASDHNIAIGYRASKDVKGGSYNIAIGSSALQNSVDSGNNVAIGQSALYAVDVDNSGSYTDTGGSNTAVGRAAGQNISSGSSNLCLGKYSGGSNSPSGQITTADHQMCLGANQITHAYIKVSLTVSSDERDKTDFSDFSHGLDIVKNLKPVTYRWDDRSDYTTDDQPDITKVTRDGSKKKPQLEVGFKAQEVQTLMESLGHKVSDKTNVLISETSDGNYKSLQYERFVPVLVNAIKEQQTLIEALTARVTALEGA